MWMCKYPERQAGACKSALEAMQRGIAGGAHRSSGKVLVAVRVEVDAKVSIAWIAVEEVLRPRENGFACHQD
jgi:hypothetical protein